MGRVFFPTYSLNRFGARELDQRATLGGLGDLGAVQRFDPEPTPRAAMTPTGPMLGAIVPTGVLPGLYPRTGYPTVPIGILPRAPIRIVGPITYTPPRAGVPAPVSTQVGPTPTVTLPPPPSGSPLLVSSGGGTQTPSTPTVVVTQPSGFVDNIASWLGKSTTLFNYNVPNAVIAGVVVLGFALFSSDSRRRR